MFSLESNNMWLVNSQHAAEGGLEGLPTTPHLAVIGSSMGDIKKIIVAVDSTRSLEKAMGLLLGAFFVFNVAYPPDCPLTHGAFAEVPWAEQPNERARQRQGLRNRTKVAEPAECTLNYE
ncbi:uncharacterized protein LOC144129849 [Amblyomma americanum]